jgi:hypothetical protein
MIFVEKTLQSLDEELQALQSNTFKGPNGKMFALGAVHALVWVKAGGLPPSASTMFPPVPYDSRTEQ